MKGSYNFCSKLRLSWFPVVFIANHKQKDMEPMYIYASLVSAKQTAVKEAAKPADNPDKTSNCCINSQDKPANVLKATA